MLRLRSIQKAVDNPCLSFEVTYQRFDDVRPLFSAFPPESGLIDFKTVDKDGE